MKYIMLLLIPLIPTLSIAQKPPKPKKVYYDKVYEVIQKNNETYVRVHKGDTLIKIAGELNIGVTGSITIDDSKPKKK